MSKNLRQMLLIADFKKIIKLPDSLYLKLRFKEDIGKVLDLKNPKTYNEKLQWLKLHDRNPEYIKMSDKLAVKDFIAEKIGREYVVPTMGVYDNFDEIDFNKLPNQFVIKTTHDSGGVAICKNKKEFDIKKAREKINKSLEANYYRASREWPYKFVKPRIIIEEYLEDAKDKELRDYKFFVFNGEAKLMFIASNRQSSEETCFDFYDMEFKHLPFLNGHPNASEPPHRPKNFKKMIELAEVLGEGIPHVRVDFYEVDGKIYVGEMTFYHWGGLTPFVPGIWDEKIGRLLKLPK